MNKLSLQLTDKMLTNSNFKTGPKFWGLTPKLQSTEGLPVLQPQQAPESPPPASAFSIIDGRNKMDKANNEIIKILFMFMVFSL
ncbi:MAG TPA: hypothetical protein VLB82_11770 [Thermodesulfobacteriota bacterium]|nr:hypothetical protein [Thermodesulfobacteriota bacterium]